MNTTTTTTPNTTNASNTTNTNNLSFSPSASASGAGGGMAYFAAPNEAAIQGWSSVSSTIDTALKSDEIAMDGREDWIRTTKLSDNYSPHPFQPPPFVKKASLMLPRALLEQYQRILSHEIIIIIIILIIFIFIITAATLA